MRIIIRRCKGYYKVKGRIMIANNIGRMNNAVTFGKKFPTVGVLTVATGKKLSNEGHFQASEVRKHIDLKEYGYNPETLDYAGVHKAYQDIILEKCPQLKKAVDESKYLGTLIKGEWAVGKWVDKQVKEYGNFIDIDV